MNNQKSSPRDYPNRYLINQHNCTVNMKWDGQLLRTRKIIEFLEAVEEKGRFYCCL